MKINSVIIIAKYLQRGMRALHYVNTHSSLCHSDLLYPTIGYSIYDYINTHSSLLLSKTIALGGLLGDCQNRAVESVICTL